MQPDPAAERLFDVLNRHDLELLDSVLADDFVLEDVAAPGTRSREAFTAEMDLIFAGLPDLIFRPVRVVEDAGAEVIEFRAMGTHKGAFLNIQPTDSFALVSGVFTIRVENDRIARLRLTIDFGG